MKLTHRRGEEDKIRDRYTVPVSPKMKEALDKIRDQDLVDVNEMARRFFKALIDQAANEEQNAS